jgi:cytochrome c-type biogenesis protein CcmH/NrfG
MVQRLNHTFDRALIVAAFVALLAGCVTEEQAPPSHPASRSPYPAPPPQTAPRQPAPSPYPYPTQPAPQPAPAPAPQPDRAQPRTQSSATLALQDEAQRAATAGDLSKATQILERAIRIEPDRPELWIELARVHLKEGNPAQAEQFARKALLFTGGRYDLEQQAWVIIADARAAKN